jgi:hypothetical protein
MPLTTAEACGPTDKSDRVAKLLLKFVDARLIACLNRVIQRDKQLRMKIRAAIYAAIAAPPQRIQQQMFRPHQHGPVGPVRLSATVDRNRPCRPNCP